jgi:hypothetical protein
MANACVFRQRDIAGGTAWNYNVREMTEETRHLPAPSAATDPVRREADSAGV